MEKYEAALRKEIEQLKENREKQRAVYREEENRDKALEELQGVIEEVSLLLRTHGRIPLRHQHPILFVAFLLQFDSKNDEAAVAKSSLPPSVLKRKRAEIYEMVSAQADELIGAKMAASKFAKRTSGKGGAALDSMYGQEFAKVKDRGWAIAKGMEEVMRSMVNKTPNEITPPPPSSASSIKK